MGGIVGELEEVLGVGGSSCSWREVRFPVLDGLSMGVEGRKK